MDHEHYTDLTQVAPNIWCAEGPVSPAPGFSMATRMTVIRLADDTLWVHSPLLMPDPLVRAVEALGEVSHVVAPNLFHHLYLKYAQQHWPDAQFWGPAGLDDKRDDVRFDHELTEGDHWDGQFLVLPIAGMPKFREWVFFHQPSGTLVVTDLVFNEPQAHNGMTGFFFRLAGTRGKLALSRLFNSQVKDKQAFLASCGRLHELEIERVVMAHGKILEDDARARFCSVCPQG